MARLTRFCPPGIPQHLIQRGNNRSACFVQDEDYAAYAKWLKEYSQEYLVDIHCWVFMTNHVHLLATPTSWEGLSKMMQALGRRYVRYFNRRYRRTGTLWEGRFKSSLVQSGAYLLQCYRYIELNPVRAKMVSKPSDYVWSSYRCNGLGVDAKLCTPHEEYMKLGSDKESRLNAYRVLFDGYMDDGLLAQIRGSVNKGLALGNERFKEEIEVLYGRRLRAGKRGRPRKNFI